MCKFELLLFQAEMISTKIPLGKCASWRVLQIDAKEKKSNLKFWERPQNEILEYAF